MHLVPRLIVGTRRGAYKSSPGVSQIVIQPSSTVHGIRVSA